ncbi:DMT family transporter [Clostridium paridis]|nr:EamA family transporter [Clostridium paridis]
MMKLKKVIRNESFTQKQEDEKYTKEVYVNYLASISAVLLWSASFIATKLAYRTFAPIQLGEVRTIFAVVIFGLIRRATKNNERISKEHRKYVAVSGLLGITLYFTTENIGVSMTSSSNAALIVASFPAITTLLEFFIYRSKPSVRKIIGIILALVGVTILTHSNVLYGTKSLWGNVILICAGIVWAFYNFITRKITNKYSAITLTYYQMLSGAVFFVPFVFIEDAPWRLPNFTSISSLIYLSVGCSVAAFLLYNLGLRKLSASVSVSFLNLVPVLGLALSVLILGETVSIKQISGGIIVIIGVILSSI